MGLIDVALKVPWAKTSLEEESRGTVKIVRTSVLVLTHGSHYCVGHGSW